jgi:hypothetical protein
MAFLDRYCQAVFDHSFTLPVQRDLLRCIINSYRMADTFVKPLHYAEANYLRGHKRRADIESELRGVAARYPEVEASIELNRTLSAYYTVLSAGRVRLTQSRANNPYQMIQHAIFRQDLAAEAQLDLFLPPPPTPLPIDKLLFALLLHGYDKPEKSKPSFVHIVFPDHLCQFYVARINLLTRFPEVAAEMIPATQGTTEEEPQVAIRRDREIRHDQEERNA